MFVSQFRIFMLNKKICLCFRLLLKPMLELPEIKQIKLEVKCNIMTSSIIYIGWLKYMSRIQHIFLAPKIIKQYLLQGAWTSSLFQLSSKLIAYFSNKKTKNETFKIVIVSDKNWEFQILRIYLK